MTKEGDSHVGESCDLAHGSPKESRPPCLAGSWLAGDAIEQPSRPSRLLIINPSDGHAFVKGQVE